MKALFNCSITYSAHTQGVIIAITPMGKNVTHLANLQANYFAFITVLQLSNIVIFHMVLLINYCIELSNFALK